MYCNKKRVVVECNMEMAIVDYNKKIVVMDHSTMKHKRISGLAEDEMVVVVVEAEAGARGLMRNTMMVDCKRERVIMDCNIMNNKREMVL